MVRSGCNPQFFLSSWYRWEVDGLKYKKFNIQQNIPTHTFKKKKQVDKLLCYNITILRITRETSVNLFTFQTFISNKTFAEGCLFQASLSLSIYISIYLDVVSVLHQAVGQGVGEGRVPNVHWQDVAWGVLNANLEKRYAIKKKGLEKRRGIQKNGGEFRKTIGNLEKRQGIQKNDRKFRKTIGNLEKRWGIQKNDRKFRKTIGNLEKRWGIQKNDREFRKQTFAV